MDKPVKPESKQAGATLASLRWANATPEERKETGRRLTEARRAAARRRKRKGKAK